MIRTLLIILIISTASAKAQSSTSITFKDTSFVRKLNVLIAEHKAFKQKIVQKDSVINEQSEVIKLKDLKYESCKVEKTIIEHDSKAKTEVIKGCYSDNEKLKSDNKNLENKLRFQKRLKWVFGAIGAIAVATITIVF